MTNQFVAGALAVTILFTGCTSTKTSSTARTGVEQLLISTAVDESLDKVDFQAFQGRKVLVEEKYIDCVDKAYVVGSVRHRVARAGGELTAKPEDANIVLEIRSGGVGTDTSDSFVGIPEIALPGMITLPEVRLVSRLHQTGTAKLALVAYDAKTMQQLGDGGVSLSRADDNNWYALGIGPYQNGSLKRELQKSNAGVNRAVYNELPAHVAFYPSQDSGHEESPFRFTSGVDETR